MSISQIRKYKNESTLILGCGNMSNEQDQHHGCYTIDPDIKRNPSLQAKFGIDNVKNYLPSQCFYDIIFEGFILEPYEWCRGFGTNKNIIDTLYYLLKEGGFIYGAWLGKEPQQIFQRLNGVLVSKKGEIITNDDEFLQFYKIM